jgi:hypothetical protein
MLDVVDTLSPNLQVIVTDHAFLLNERFQSSVIEVWRKGEKLIPETWEDL